jgi:hypothetical protein
VTYAADGKIYASGDINVIDAGKATGATEADKYKASVTGHKVAVYRFLADGTPDQGFGSAGRTVWEGPDGEATSMGLAETDDGSVVVDVNVRQTSKRVGVGVALVKFDKTGKRHVRGVRADLESQRGVAAQQWTLIRGERGRAPSGSSARSRFVSAAHEAVRLVRDVSRPGRFAVQHRRSLRVRAAGHAARYGCVSMRAQLAGALCAIGCVDAAHATTSCDLSGARQDFSYVSGMLSERCGTLDCHGQVGRPLRFYGSRGLRLDPDDSSGHGGTRSAEHAANLLAVLGLEPELTCAVLEAHGDDPDRLSLVRKPSGGEAHKGDVVFATPDDAGSTCLLGWLSGQLDREACQRASEEKPE